jgi:hypothetical protein
MSRVFLIASGAYVGAELAAEFGPLPPAFLPLGNRRLFTHQIATLALTGAPAGGVPIGARTLLSIPEDFFLDPADLAILNAAHVELVPVPLGLSLGQSIVYVINVTASSAGAFSVLYGDTLQHGIDLTALDAVSVADVARPGLGWGYVIENQGRLELVKEPSDGATLPLLSGFLAFADAALLVQSVTRAGGDFLRGTAAYSQKRPLGLVRAAQWLDFGHATTYHQSRQAATTERAFNTLATTRRSVTKSGSKPHKIEAEAGWFETLPPPLRVFTPAYLGRGQVNHAPAYDIEYLNLPTLADLLVFGRLPRQAWERILDACDEFLRLCASYPVTDAGDTAALYLDKTLDRLHAYAAAAGISLDQPTRLNGKPLPSPRQMAQAAASAIPPTCRLGATLVHGDFCFSNILYDFRAERVRVIDPRGLDAAGRFSASGDLRYDIGKLHHSAVGQYDTILAGRFTLAQRSALDIDFTVAETASTRAVRDAFLARDFTGLSRQEAASDAVSILLFLSMLPLHEDDPKRQTALLANAMRLFARLDE